ncbi:MAG: electron transport complex subunit RsxC [Candidatus Ornithospirochaeta sp.]|nr:electron transport complex subunit RsxC [Candidatus Ornithospirochaeta sp.]
MRSRFFGGVHPKENKEMAGHALPEELDPPSQVIIPLKQHIGVICKPLVKVGDKVVMGQKIGDAEGLSVPVHSSVSGTVVAIERRPNIMGEVESIVIENDFRDTRSSSLERHDSIDGLSDDEILHIIREAGLVGMGGATFPTDVKSSVVSGQIDTVIANICECEPYITSDDTLICNFTEYVLKGVSIIARMIKPKRVVLAVEDNKAEGIERLRSLLPSYPGIEIDVLKTRYPQGAEKQLIFSVTGREVPSGKLPKDVGCIVFNAATYASIAKAVYEGEPSIRRIVTVTGEGIEKPRNVIVRIGTPIEHAIKQCGGLKDGTIKVLAGGPMMGACVSDLSSPIVKGTNAITALMERKAVEDPKCIRCGKCFDHCPMRLQPLYMNRYAQANDLDALRRLHVIDCMECGCCAYVCPARIPLVENFRKAKKALREAGK